MSLSLRTINFAGQAVPNPLAQTLQEALAKDAGYSELPIDGKWGDCSQQTFFNEFGGKFPSAKLIRDTFVSSPNASVMAEREAISEQMGVDNVKVWDKKTGLYCPNAPVKDNKLAITEGYYDPLIMLARNSGVKLPDEILCPPNDLGQGYTVDYEKGACINKKFVPPKITFSQGPGIIQNIKPSLTYSFKNPTTTSPQAVDISSDKKYTVPVTASASAPLDLSKFGTMTPKKESNALTVGLVIAGVLVVGAGIVYASTRK